MIYLDASALVKLVFDEEESESLASWLRECREAPKLTSALSMVEVVRTCRRVDAATVVEATRRLAGLDQIPISTRVVALAADAGDVRLRGLDAIHLASAQLVRDDLSAFVAYDERLRSAAAAEHLEVVAPGAAA